MAFMSFPKFLIRAISSAVRTEWISRDRSSAMSQGKETQTTSPNVQDKRKPAPGVLLKNAQTWVVMGLTAVIMLMLWVSGPAKGAKSSQKPDAPKTETVAGLSPAEIGARLEQERREQRMPFSPAQRPLNQQSERGDRKSTRLNSSHSSISYA